MINKYLFEKHYVIDYTANIRHGRKWMNANERH